MVDDDDDGRRHINELPPVEMSLFQRMWNGIRGVIPRQCPECREVFTESKACRPIDDMVER